MNKQYAFEPDYAVPPGATLRETLEVKGISQADLALRTGMAEKTISQIINGIAPISHDTAEKLELALDIPAKFWNRRELTYRESLARIAANERLAAEVAWLDEVPVKELIDRKRVSATATGGELVREVLKFFGVSTVEAWRETWGNPMVQYRGKEVQKKKPGYVAAWLRLGELQADGIETLPHDGAALKQALPRLRDLTIRPVEEWKTQLPKICAEFGVAVVITREIPGASVSGATHWLSKDKALLQLSLKYKSDDQFWFTFFHEVGHILLHGKRKVFIECGQSSEDAEEQQADEFARNLLIPPHVAHRLPHLKTRAMIQQFAQQIGVSPGIVVGRLQKDDFVFPSAFYDLKIKLAWAK